MPELPKPREAVVTIYGGDYLDRIRHLERQAETAAEAFKSENNDASATLDQVPEYLTIVREHEQLVQEAEKDALHVRVRALPRKVWKKLVKEHPPRSFDDVPDHNPKPDASCTCAGCADRAVGVNEETFKDALVEHCGTTASGTKYATVIEPQDLDFLEELADVDFDRIYLTAFALNRSPAAGPKAGLASRLTRKNDETSS